MRIFRHPLIIASLMALPVLAFAASFTDVPSTHPHREAIEKLADAGVISGNPDGTFRPGDPVNRAAILKMLYLAGGLEASGKASAKQCFPDVPADSWFATYVCDAAARGFVKGYADGKFWPGRPVSRAEALKLTVAVLGIPMRDPLASSHLYTDVAASDWFAVYVRSALAASILPIPGQMDSVLHPSWPLERGEAAAYIWNAKNKVPLTSASSAASSTESAVTSSASGRASSASKSASSAEADRILNVKMPFAESAQFSGKKTVSYRFTVTATTLFEGTVQLRGSDTGALTCSLYQIASDGFTSKYYLGLQEGGNCYLRASLDPGDYQLQLAPTVADTWYVLDAKIGTTTDGNDGFAQAKILSTGSVKVDLLDANDLADYYTFTVVSDTTAINTGGKLMTVKVLSTPFTDCLIYPLANVDLFGFSGPECGKQYLFPGGTYVVVIRHPAPRAGKITYTIQVQ